MNSVWCLPTRTHQSPPCQMRYDSAQDQLGFCNECRLICSIRTPACGTEQSYRRPHTQYEIVGKWLVSDRAHGRS